jgi:hypothetical protein
MISLMRVEATQDQDKFYGCLLILKFLENNTSSKIGSGKKNNLCLKKETKKH